MAPAKASTAATRIASAIAATRLADAAAERGALSVSAVESAPIRQPTIPAVNAMPSAIPPLRATAMNAEPTPCRALGVAARTATVFGV